MNKFLILLLFVYAFVSCEAEFDSIVFHQFKKFIKKYNKKYESVNEYLARYVVFKKNFMNSFMNENKSYQTGITKFSDLTKKYSPPSRRSRFMWVILGIFYPRKFRMYI